MPEPNIPRKGNDLQGVFLQVLHELDEVSSTNQWLKDQLRNGNLPTGTVVRALHQTSGRGQIGTSWQDEPGKNLLMSAYFKPINGDIQQVYFLNMSICLAVAELCERTLDRKVMIKWPNDIFVGQKKLAGILVENGLSSRWESCIFGIGCNVNQVHFSPNFSACSLKSISGSDYSLYTLTAKLLFLLEEWLAKWRFGEYSQISEAYHQRLLGKDEWRLFFYREEVIEACIREVNGSGEIILETSLGTILNPGIKELKYIWKQV